MINNVLYSCLSIVLMTLVWSCKQAPDNKLADLELQSLNEEQVTLRFKEIEKLKAFFFLSPECPFCINYTKTLSEIIHNKRYSDISFYAVYPGTYYSHEEINKFHEEYDFEINVLVDTEFQLTHLVNATVTPEVVLVDKSGSIIYTGAIDNWAVDTGVKRQVITEHYLIDALESVLTGKTPPKSKTKPVGCYIEL